MQHLHTFAVPAYGASPYLNECVGSLVRQETPSEIYITTGTPNERIFAVGAKYNVPVYVNPNGGGIGRDWNFALSKATTPYVTIAHQDDFYSKDYTSEILKEFEVCPNTALVFTGYHELRNGKAVPDNLNLNVKKTLLYPFKLHPSPATQKLAVLFGSSICCPSVTYNLPLLGEGFAFDEDMESNLDWKKWVELTNDGIPFAYIPKGLVLHRIHEGSATSEQIKNENRSKEDREVFEMLWPKPIAAGISKLYGLSQSSNRQKTGE